MVYIGFNIIYKHVKYCLFIEKYCFYLNMIIFIFDMVIGILYLLKCLINTKQIFFQKIELWQNNYFNLVQGLTNDYNYYVDNKKRILQGNKYYRPLYLFISK